MMTIDACNSGRWWSMLAAASSGRRAPHAATLRYSGLEASRMPAALAEDALSPFQSFTKSAELHSPVRKRGHRELRKLVVLDACISFERNAAHWRDQAAFAPQSRTLAPTLQAVHFASVRQWPIGCTSDARTALVNSEATAALFRWVELATKTHGLHRHYKAVGRQPPVVSGLLQQVLSEESAGFRERRLSLNLDAEPDDRLNPARTLSLRRRMHLVDARAIILLIYETKMARPHAERHVAMDQPERG